MSQRPRNIGLGSIVHYRFPVTAIASILHRASGLLLFIAIPFVLWGLMVSLVSPYGFEAVRHFFDCGVIRFLTWLFGSALIYHMLAGIKHLFMDCGRFEGKLSGRIASWCVLILSLVLIVWFGVAVW